MKKYLPGPVESENTSHCNMLVRACDGEPAGDEPIHELRQCAGERGHGPGGTWCRAHAAYFESLRRKTLN